MSITFCGILIYAGVATFSLLYILKQKNDLLFEKLDSVHWAFLIYISAFSLSALINTGTGKAFHVFSRTCQDYFVFLWAISVVCNLNNNNKYKSYETLKAFILFSGIISVSYGLCQYFHFDIFHRQSDLNRLSGFHKNPYSYGGQLIIFFFLFLNELITTRSKFITKFFLFILLIAALFCILHTFERAIIFGIIPGVIAYLLLSKCNLKTLLLPLSAILPAAFIIISLNQKLYKRLINTFINLNNRPNARFKLWNIALSVWKRNLFFGVSEFPKVIHDPGGGLKVQVLSHAHNVYLQMLVTHGIVGLLAFLNLFVAIFKTLLSNTNSKYVICLLSVLFSFLLEGIFEYFWGDSEVRYLLLYFMGFVFGHFKSANYTVNS